MCRKVILIALFIETILGAVIQNPKGLLGVYPDGRIVGGENTEIENFAYQISLRYYGSHRCGGFIISPNVVISAAHCVQGIFTKSSLKVIAGTSVLSSGGITRNLKSFSYHQKFDPNTIDYDISLLVLQIPLTFDQSITAIKLPVPNQIITAGSNAVVTGWGRVSQGGSIPNNLQKLNLTIVDHRECVRDYSGINLVTDRMICAGGIIDGKGVCNGDSGGPLVVGDTVVGIVSWGVACAIKGYPGVFTRVAALRSWIDATGSSVVM